MDLSDIRVVLCPEDLERVGRFRYAVYVEEQRKNARHADHARKLLVEPEDRAPNSMVLWIEREGQVAGTVRSEFGPFNTATAQLLQLDRLPFARTDQMLMFSRLMVARSRRHLDITPKLFFAALAIALSKGLHMGVLTCRPELRPVFESYGCLQYGTPFFHDDAGEQIPLAVLGEHEYLAVRKSPAASWVRLHRPDSPLSRPFLEAVARLDGLRRDSRRATRLIPELP